MRSSCNDFNIDDAGEIDLFPIQYFQFPKSRREEVYKILDIIPDARPTFDKMLDTEKVIPIANIYNNPIEYEGHGDMVHSTHIEQWRNIHRIRAAFFEKGFPRLNLNVANSPS